jgi:hypothetical protein
LNLIHVKISRVGVDTMDLASSVENQIALYTNHKELYHGHKVSLRNLDAARGYGSFRFGLCRTATVRPALVAEPQPLGRDQSAVASDH